jgi:PAS domain S-box-containing protein
VEDKMGKKILVVDNHPVMLKMMTLFLEKEGHQVLTAGDGLSALNILKTFTPDVIFADLIMPRVDGKKLCKIIRKMPRLREVYIVIISAIVAEDGESFSEYGANACIAKGPFDKMSEHILEALGRMEQKAISTDQVMGLDMVFPRQITKELLSIKKQFDVTLRSMVEGFLETTPEGNVVYANPASISIIGQSEETLLASNFLDLFRGEEREKVGILFRSAGDLPRSTPEDSPAKLNGKEVSLQVLPITEGDYRALILILNDVSERKRLGAQLLHAQKMEAIGTLAGGIAHDFNNLLMVVQGNVSLMLLDLEPSHPHYEMLKHIEKRVQNGSKLTHQLLGYARKGRYEVKPILLNQLVEKTVEAFGRTRKNIVIHLDLKRNLPSLEADPGQIEQVLMNLLVNAADAMPDGGNLLLKTRNVTHQEIEADLYEPVPGNYILLSVIDTGVGMDQKTMARIFDPFFTTKELGRGTGLGLASVYGIIKGHNGYISVQSERGKGATFLVYLPASEKGVEEPSEKGDEMVMGRETVLLVDDEDYILDVGEKILKTLGYQVFIADSGEKAVEIYQTNRDQIDLVILDLIMPHKGGGETFDALREIHWEVKALLSSGYSMDGQTMEIMNKGCKGFIQKPFSIMELSQKLREILDKK